MRFLKYIYAAVFAYCLLSATPAVAQFEVSPDHFDGPQTANKNTASSKKAQNQANSETKTAARKTATNTGGQKPSPGRGSANTGTLAAHSTHKSRSQKASKSSAAAPSLKAQAFPVHRE